MASQADIHFGQGLACWQRGQPGEAAIQFQQALRLKRGHVDAHYYLGMALQALGQPEEAMLCFEETLDLQPDFAPGYSALGEALHHQGQLTAASRLLRQALHLQPRSPGLHNNLGNVLFEQGYLQAAIAHYRRALALYADLGTAPSDPDYVQTHCNLVFGLWALPGLSEAHLFAAARQRAEIHGRSLYPRKPPRAQQHPGRLRIGYLSTDFAQQSAAASFLAFFTHHDRERFEFFIYADVIAPDTMTHRFQGLGHHWRPVAGLDAKAISRLIQTDGIDILVDLCGRRAKSFMVMALQPAPAQVMGFGLGHCTTGLPTVHYRLSDSHVTPPQLVPYNSEKVAYLDSWIAWQPPDWDLPPELPRPGQPQAVTFGCGNSLFKLNEPLLHLWAQLLQALPASRLWLKAFQLDDPPTAQRIRQLFEGRGIGPERLILSGRSSHLDHIRFYSQIDIALDPFPYNGGISTCEALWMGVPVISLAGGTRSGVSLLNGMGLGSWVAQTPAEYIEKALALAHQPDRQAWRAALREKVTQAPLCQGKAFTRKLEQVFRQIWQERSQAP